MSNQHSKCDDCYKTHLPEVHDRSILPSEAFSEGYVPVFNQDELRGGLKVLVRAYVGPMSKLDELMSVIDSYTQKAVTEARIDELNNLVYDDNYKGGIVTDIGTVRQGIGVRIATLTKGEQ